jgi:hypothetical protein
LYVDRLMGAANPADVRYTGPVSGVVNAATRSALVYWLDNRLRCPVVISAYTVDAAGTRTGVFAGHENVWQYREVPNAAPRFFARDFSGYYTLPPGRNPDDLIVVGDYTPALTGGPRSMPPAHTWAEAEILPEHLVGAQLAELNAAQRSTFKVVRAVSEVECIGFFDSINAYDTGFVSLGPCHWTLAILFGGVMNEGELGSYLAYLRHADPEAFQAAVGFFGVRIDENWFQGGIDDGSALYVAGQRKYTGWVSLQDETNNFVRRPLTQDEANYFRSWHWIYRFEMAGRTIEGYRRRMWDMARIRLRDILSARWPTAAHVPDVPADAGGTRRAMVGDVYTSERAMAMLLRWHVNMPATVFSGGVAANRLANAFQRASIPPAAGNPATWTDAHEASLIQGIRDEVTALGNANLIDTINQVDAWPAWAAGGAANPRGFALDPAIGNLAVTRNSLQFDADGLPPTPY